MSFLAKLGVKLRDSVIESPTIDVVQIDEPQMIKEPFISALGYEIVPNNISVSHSFDPLDPDVRMSVLNSFSQAVLFVQDTKSAAKVSMQATPDNTLVAVVGTINPICSKMHIEDISPVDNNIFNHDKSGCDDAHFPDDAILIEPGDYQLCDKNDANIRVKNKYAHFKSDKHWSKINIIPGIEDGYYRLNVANFK
jgi:hypothetical protein